MSDNLYHKLLGLPENNDQPNYYGMLELTEGNIDATKVEEAYKKQIQKVQRFTNNPKYKDGALFVKGELRKARSTLVDEGRRMAYQREMMTQRAQQIRNILRPLLIKGYLVEEEFKYLNQHAGRLDVPEAMVQQVLKQELQKKGIDPATALVEGSGVPGKVSAKALPTGPQRKKKAVSMSLAARFTLFRDPLGTFIALCVWPLRMVGILKSPPKQVVQQAGFFDYHPFVATSLFWIGLLALALPFPFIRMTTTIGVQGRDKDRYINEIRDQQDKIKKLTKGGPAMRQQLDESRFKVQNLRHKIQSLTAELTGAGTKLLKAEGERNKARIKIAKLEKQLKNSSGGSGEFTQYLKKQVKKLEGVVKKLEGDLVREKAKKGGVDPAKLATAKKQRAEALRLRDAWRFKHDAVEKQQRVFTEDWKALVSRMGLQSSAPMGYLMGKTTGGWLVRFPAGVKLKPKMTFQVYQLTSIGEVTLFNNPDIKQNGRYQTAKAKVKPRNRDVYPIETSQPVGVLIRK
ncbi:hypothetical protein JYT15_00960 [Acidimicrobium ferrooxidans]|nr:hypothetical protein [Acidimicrobium ferrooxidans]